MTQTSENRPTDTSHRRSLGSILDGIESTIGRLNTGIQVDAGQILTDMDEAYSRLRDARQNHSATQSETAQFEYLESQIRKSGSQILSKLGGAAQLKVLRVSRQPEPELWWWFLDSKILETRKARLGSVAKKAGLSLAILVIVAVVYQYFFAPDPLVSQVYGYQQNSQDQLVNGDLMAASQSIQSALEIQPENPESLILAGMINRSKGDLVQAQTYFDTAIGLTDALSFYQYRCQVALQTGDAETLLSDAGAILAEYPDLAEAFFYRGKGYELTGATNQALADYEMASELAGQQNKTELMVTVRLNMASLAQSGFYMDFEGTLAP
jgi:tetratricopeptide (TPR) repeat protein